MPVFKKSFLSRQSVEFVVTAVFVTVFLIPLQLLSMVAFDSTGLDTAVPTPVFIGLLPAVVVAILPAVVAIKTYGHGRALLWIGVLLSVECALALSLAQLYGTCDVPNCVTIAVPGLAGG